MTSCFHIMDQIGENQRRRAYVWSSSPGGGTGGEVCRLRLHRVCDCVGVWGTSLWGGMRSSLLMLMVMMMMVGLMAVRGSRWCCRGTGRTWHRCRYSARWQCVARRLSPTTIYLQYVWFILYWPRVGLGQSPLSLYFPAFFCIFYIHLYSPYYGRQKHTQLNKQADNSQTKYKFTQ